MEELMQLRSFLEAGKMPEALELLAEMEEMSRDDKISKIESYISNLLIHLIKQKAEEHTTVSWDLSIENALRQINKTNRRRNADGVYLKNDKLEESINQEYSFALRVAASEAFAGAFTAKQLGERIDSAALKKEALEKILTYKED